MFGRPAKSAWLSPIALMASAASACATPYAAGQHYFPATPLTEDPFVADELAVTATHTRHRASDSEPATRSTELTYEAGFRLSETLGVTLEHGFTILDPSGSSQRHGFGNPELGIKYQLYQNDAHEGLISIGLQHEFGAVGAARIGAEPVGNTTPAVYAAKGFGDLPAALSYMRPLAMTASIGYQISDEPAHTTTEVDATSGAKTLDREYFPDTLQLGFSLQYSLRYLEGNVKYLALPEPITRLTPLVEFELTTPARCSCGSGTEGQLGAGLVYDGDRYYLGVEALVPTTRAAGSGVGFIASLTLRLDAMFPAAFGTPLLSGRRLAP
jgi:hypothetical protein